MIDGIGQVNGGNPVFWSVISEQVTMGPQAGRQLKKHLPMQPTSDKNRSIGTAFSGANRFQ
jgi:hypothetical protein